jgi:hypothetical protein
MSNAPEVLREFVVGLILLVILLAIFDIVMKSIAMWKAARRMQTAWFVCLLIFNTLGILPIIYLLTGAKKPETLINT